MDHLRAQGFLSVDYLDDILLIRKDHDECHTNVKITRAFLESLGFILNEKKCNLFPSKQCKFLGFEMDSQEYTISLPKQKKLKILNLIKSMINKSEIKIRLCADNRKFSSRVSWSSIRLGSH